MEGNTQFSEFEKRLKKGHPTAYHEEIEQRLDLPIGTVLAMFGLFPFLFSNFTMGTIQIIGIVASFIGILLIIRGFVVYRKQLKRYSFRNLTRRTISDAIMYLDAQLAQLEEFESPVPYHDKFPVSSYKLSMKKHEFTKFLMHTAGLVTWPSVIVEEHETTIQTNKRTLYNTLVLLIAVSLILAVVVFYLLTTWDLLILAWMIVPVYCMIQILYQTIPHFSYLKYYYNSDWLTKVLKSDSIKLDEILDEIFMLLQSEFPYPLRFDLVREYPQLKYTGRTKTSLTLVKLKEAVLYPSI